MMLGDLGADVIKVERPGQGDDTRAWGPHFVVQAESGWMAIAGKDAAIAILAALVARSRGMRVARHLNIYLADSARAALINVAQNALVSGTDASRWGNAHANLVLYQLFQAQDRGIVIAVGNDDQWRVCVRALGLAGMAADERLRTNRGRLKQRELVVGAFQQTISRRPAADWLRALVEVRVPCGLVKTVLEAIADAGGGIAGYRDAAQRGRIRAASTSGAGRAWRRHRPPPLGGVSSRRPSTVDGRFRCAYGVTARVLFRPTFVATVLLPQAGVSALSYVRQRRYSTLVKATESEPLTADQNTDQLIIQRVLGGNRDAFRLLIGRYTDPLYRHALCMTGSPDVAEDILQLSFIKAYQHLAEVRGRFDAWVFRIVANGCKDWLKNIRRSHLSYDEDDQPSAFATPDQELDRTELRSDLDVALATLPASLREAFVMKHIEGRSYEEMADLLGTTVGALKMRVHRAREALQALLEEKYA